MDYGLISMVIIKSDCMYSGIVGLKWAIQASAAGSEHENYRMMR